MTLKEWAADVVKCEVCGSSELSEICIEHAALRHTVKSENERDTSIYQSAYNTGYKAGYNNGERTQMQFPRGEGG